MGWRKSNHPSVLYSSNRSDEEITNLFPDTFIPEDEQDDDGSDRYVLVAGGSNKGERVLIDKRGYKLTEKSDSSDVSRIHTSDIFGSFEIK